MNIDIICNLYGSYLHIVVDDLTWYIDPCEDCMKCAEEDGKRSVIDKERKEAAHEIEKKGKD